MNTLPVEGTDNGLQRLMPLLDHQQINLLKGQQLSPLVDRGPFVFRLHLFIPFFSTDCYCWPPYIFKLLQESIDAEITFLPDGITYWFDPYSS